MPTVLVNFIVVYGSGAPFTAALTAICLADFDGVTTSHFICYEIDIDIAYLRNILIEFWVYISGYIIGTEFLQAFR